MSLMDQITGLFKGRGGSDLVKSATEMMGEGKLSLSKMVENFKAAGLGDKVQSWIGTGKNEPISAEEIKRGSNPENLQEMADKAGISVDEAAEQLSKTLPDVVDKMTPDGVLPSDDQVKSRISGT